MTRALISVFAFLLLTITSGCTHPARARFANEFDCPRSRTELQDLGAHSYRVSGCSEAATYVCRNDLCVMDAANDTGSSGDSREAASARAGAAEVSRVSLDRGSVNGGRAVRLSFDHLLDISFLYAAGEAEYVVAWIEGPDGEATSGCRALMLRTAQGPHVELLPPNSDERVVRTTVASMLAVAGERGPFALELCGTRIQLTETETRIFLQFLREIRELRGNPTRDSSSSTETSSASGGSNGADVRAWLDAHGELILGCTGTQLVVVRVQRGAGDGSTVSLQAPHAGTPEEECVRHGLGEPPAGPPGLTVHPVRLE